MISIHRTIRLIRVDLTGNVSINIKNNNIKIGRPFKRMIIDESASTAGGRDTKGLKVCQPCTCHPTTIDVGAQWYGVGEWVGGYRSDRGEVSW